MVTDLEYPVIARMTDLATPAFRMIPLLTIPKNGKSQLGMVCSVQNHFL
jgi:hypothetical protein